MGREFELKYMASPEQLAAIEGAFEGFHTIRMETTYYDAPDGILRRLRWTLRRRMENEVSICTLKTTLFDGSRGSGKRSAATFWQPCPNSLPWVPPGS